jgi:cytochrome c-type biogenesis protein CcsB
VSVAVNESFAQLSNNFMYSGMAVYTVAMVSYAAEWAFGAPARTRGQVGQRTAEPVTVGAGAGASIAPPPELEAPAAEAAYRSDRFGRIAVSLTVLAFGLHLAAVGCRGLSEGRVPWGNMYEFSTAAALAVTGAFLILLTRYDVRWLGIFVVTPVLLVLGVAVTLLYADSGPLIPALQSYWLAIHVTAAVISTGAFTIGTLATVLFLVSDRYARRHDGARLGRLPAPEVLDTIAHRVYTFVFPLWTFAIMAGAIWAENAWSRYWGWDPKETWSFITWVVFAAYLHARATAGWRGRRAAMVALVGYGCLLFNFIGVNMWITGLHSYA